MIIIHRCRRCKHPDIFHGNGSCCYTSCPCAVPEYAAPEVIPTWTPEWQLVEAITPPGTRDRSFGQLCGCDACGQMYEQEIR